MMDKVTNTKISRAFSKAARWQIIITVLISCVSLLAAGMNAAISAIAGGASVIVGGFAGMMMARRPNGGTPGAILFSMLKAEVIRVLVIAMLLLVAFRYYPGLFPLSLIGGLAGSALASGAGLRTVNNENDD
ncbi:MAG: ATP synthase subunit I [Nitrosomonadales bacterium]|nr:ATP synthase subunit I [Nitrosomonadales bacterium]